MSSFYKNSEKNSFEDPISAEQMFRLAFSLPGGEFDRICCRGWKPVSGLPPLYPDQDKAKIANGPGPATFADLPADVLVYQAQGNIVVEFPITTAMSEDVCLAMAGNILIIDWCRCHGMGAETEPGPGQSRRRCIILPPHVTPAQIKARIVNQHLRIEVLENALSRP